MTASSSAPRYDSDEVDGWIYGSAIPDMGADVWEQACLLKQLEHERRGLGRFLGVMGLDISIRSLYDFDEASQHALR